jgi:hypothetical protein
MIRRASTWLVLLCCATLPLHAALHDTAQDGISEILLRAMQDEMERTVDRLRLEGMDKPYFVAQTVYEQRSLSLEGSFGAIARPKAQHSRTLKLELRVGSREFDDTHFIPNDFRAAMPRTARLPVEDDYDALRFEIWSVTDSAYKQALDRLARKQAFRDARNITEIIPDLSEEEVQSSRETLPIAAFDRPAWEGRLRDASALFRDYPRITRSGVRLTLNARHLYFVDSEGRSFVRPSHLFEIQIDAEGLADDGMRQADQVKILSPSLDSLPAQKELEVAVRQLAEGVSALTAAPQAEIYLGPVLLEGQAAGEFFNQLLASGLGIARRPWAEQEWASRYFQRGRLLDRLGLRVISPLFDVWDDPTVAEWEGQPLIGHYSVDDQGIPARRVELIRRGILKEILMSRSPTEDRSHSNGHGRGTQHEPVTAQVGSLFLQPSERMALVELKRRLREEARAFGLSHGILVRRIATVPQDPEALLAPPLMVYKVDVETGREELVRDARFEAVTLRALRDVVAASTEQIVYNTQRRASRTARDMMPVSIVHPAVLLAEMELVQTTDEPTRPPILPHPYFAAAERD